MSDAAVTKVYEVKTVGGQETYNTFSGFNKLLIEMKANKQALGTFNITSNNAELVTEIKALTTQMSKFGQIGTQMTSQVAEAMGKVNMATIKNITGFHKLNASVIENRVAMTEHRRELTLEAKFVHALKDSYDEMSAELGLNTIELHKYSEAQLETDEEAKRLIARNAELVASLKRIDEAQGKFGRNVGNYATVGAEVVALKNKMEELALSANNNNIKLGVLAERKEQLLASSGTWTGSGLTAMSTELNQVNARMDELKVKTIQDEEEFEKLAIRVAELKAAIASVGVAVTEAGEKIVASGEMGRLAFEKAGETLKEITKFAIAFFGIQAGMEFISGISEEFEKADHSARNLKNTLENIGAANQFEKLTKESEEFATKFSYLDTYQVQDVFSKLITYGKLTEEQMHEALPVIIDFAAKTGKSLTESTDVITKSLEGSARGLKEFGINIKEAKTATGQALGPAERFSFIMEQLKPRVEGAAIAFSDSFGGRIGSIKKDFREMELAMSDFFVKLSGIEEANLNAAVAAKKEADAGQKLIEQYEELSNKVNQTKDDKKELASITTQLGDIFGNSVVSIDEETHALSLNIEATKSLIKQKLLLANGAAAEQAALYNAAKEDQELAQKQIEIDKKRYEAIDAKNKLNLSDGSISSGTRIPGALPGIDIIVDFQQQTKKLDEAVEKRKEALEKLSRFGYNEEDINKLFAPSKLDPSKNIPATNAGAKQISELQNTLIAAYAELQKKRIQGEMETLKVIGDDTQQSLNDRLEAYRMYYSDVVLLAQNEKDRTIAQELDKQRELDKQLKDKKITKPDHDREIKSILQRQYNATIDFNNAIAKSNDDLDKEKLTIFDNEYKKRIEYINKQKVIYETSQDQELLALSQSYAAKNITEEEYNKDKKRIQDKYNSAFLNDTISYLEKEINLSKLDVAAKKKLIDELAVYKKNATQAEIKANEDSTKADVETNDIRLQIEKSSLDLASKASASYIKILQEEDAYKQELAQKQLDWNFKLQESQTQSQKQQIENEKAKYIAEQKLAKEKAADAKKRAITQAIINEGIAGTQIIVNTLESPTAKAMPDGGLTLALIQEAALGAAFLAQIAEINSAQTYAKGGDVPSSGGMFGGMSHSSGGTPFFFGGGRFEAEAGELAIINKRSAGSNDRMSVTGTPKQIASAINAHGGGYDFAPGAQMMRFEYGGSMGGQVLPPTFIADYYSRGNGNNSGDMKSMFEALMNNQSAIMQHTHAINDRIDRLHVVLNPHHVAAANNKHEKSVKIGAL